MFLLCSTESPTASMLSSTPQFTPFGYSLSSMFSPAVAPIGAMPFSPAVAQKVDNSLSVEKIMKSSFVPTPSKSGSLFSPQPKMNLTTVLSERQIHDSVPVPISTEKQRKMEASGSYFKRMGSPTYGIKKENKPPSYSADVQRVSCLKYSSIFISSSRSHIMIPCTTVATT